MTVRNGRDLHRLITTAAPSEPPSAFELGTVTTLAGPLVTFDKDLIETPSPIQVTNGYSPVLGDRVILARVGNSWVIIGSVAAAAVPAWFALPLAANMSAYTSTNTVLPSYTRSRGIVRCRGLVKKSSAFVTGDLLGTLPAGFRHNTLNQDGTAGYLDFPSSQPSGYGTLRVYPTGAIQFVNFGGTPAYVSLAGINYFAEQ